jgi:hypothetical protein
MRVLNRPIQIVGALQAGVEDDSAYEPQGITVLNWLDQLKERVPVPSHDRFGPNSKKFRSGRLNIQIPMMSQALIESV